MSNTNIPINKDFNLGEDYTSGNKIEPDEALANARPKVSTPLFNPDPRGTSSDNYIVGPPGPKGETGAQGIPGTPGATGPAGAKGADGAIGPAGESVQGPTGSSGANLEFLWSGTQLGVRVVGETEYTYVDLAGAKGETGNTGPTGPAGPVGAQGEKGDQGDTLTQEQEQILSYFSLDVNGNLVCSQKLGIQGSVDHINGEVFAVNGFIVAEDYQTKGEASIGDTLSPVVFDVSPENILYLVQGSTITSLAAVFSAYQNDEDKSLNYEVSSSGVSTGLTINQVGFEFIVTNMDTVDSGHFDIDIHTNSGQFVGKRRVNVYKIVI